MHQYSDNEYNDQCISLATVLKVHIVNAWDEPGRCTELAPSLTRLVEPLSFGDPPSLSHTTASARHDTEPQETRRKTSN